jgi:hypothetical protein
MSDGYAPIWEPGDPVPAGERLSAEEQEKLIAEMKSAGNFTEEDEAEFRRNADTA